MNAEYYPITGIEGAFIAPVLVDTVDSFVTGVVIECPPAENANWATTQNSTPLFGNNSKNEEFFGVEINSVVLRLNGISEELDARMRGKSYISTSGHVAGAGGARPPLWALGLKINKGDEYVFVWLLKGHFSGGNVVAQTVADNVTVNMREYTFAALETTHKFDYVDAITGLPKHTGLTWFKGETANPAFAATGFFDQVQTPETTGAPSALVLSSIVPADEATGIAIGANVMLTFNNKITSSNVVLMDDEGAVVAAAQSLDAAGKILTINPTSDMAAATLHIVAVAGVIDVFGQALATTTKIFTTA